MNTVPRRGTARRLGLRQPDPYTAKLRRLDLFLQLGFSGGAALVAAGLDSPRSAETLAEYEAPMTARVREYQRSASEAAVEMQRCINKMLEAP